MINLNEKTFLVDSIIGTRDHIKRLLTVKGVSEIVAEEIIDKVEIIIALSGKLGSMLQQEKSNVEIMQLKKDLREFRAGEI